MTEMNRHWYASKWALLIYGVLIGAVIILAIRFFTYAPDQTHYHANFAVYMNGKQEKFQNPKYYQEVAVCGLQGATPLARVHMHDEVPGVIHVHDKAVTWGQFFENIGWEIGPNFLYDGENLHVANDTDKLNVVLNGQNLTGLSDITDQVIQDKDRLLVSFGDETQARLNAEFKTVPNSAAHYDNTKDPAACQGPESAGLGARFKHLF